jgi:hydroxyacylglutathione hydrolase
MILETRAAPPFMKNGYLLGCENTREGVLIDPGDEVGELLALARSLHLRVGAILLTHGHVDHVSGVAEAKAAFPLAPIYLHEADLFLYRAAPEQAEFFGLSVGELPPVDRVYDTAQPIRFGSYEVGVDPTPGHSPGGVCLRVGTAETGGPDLFVGDTLFAGSIGRTDLPGGDYPTLIRSIKDVLFRQGDAARVYPGHGAATTIGEERRTNPFLVG